MVVDESGYWRMDPKVPLVIPEVNPEAIRDHQGIIASPNCSTTQMVLALKPLHDAGRVRRVVVSTYQATSGAGLAGTRDLEGGTRAHLDGQELPVRVFPLSDRLQLHPADRLAQAQGLHVRRDEDGLRDAEDPRRRLDPDLPDLRPRARGQLPQREHPGGDREEDHRDEARELFAATPGIVVVDDLDNEAVSRCRSTATGATRSSSAAIREDLSSPNGLAFWCVSDNLRKGAATNAVQIAELLVKDRVGSG